MGVTFCQAFQKQNKTNYKYSTYPTYIYIESVRLVIILLLTAVLSLHDRLLQPTADPVMYVV